MGAEGVSAEAEGGHTGAKVENLGAEGIRSKGSIDVMM